MAVFLSLQLLKFRYLKWKGSPEMSSSAPLKHTCYIYFARKLTCWVTFNNRYFITYYSEVLNTLLSHSSDTQLLQTSIKMITIFEDNNNSHHSEIQTLFYYHWLTHSEQHSGMSHTTPKVSVPESLLISTGQSTTKILRTSSRKLHISSATRSSSLFASRRMYSNPIKRNYCKKKSTTRKSH